MAEARATVRFKTPPGQQLQIDFGERRILIAGVSTKVFLFVATPSATSGEPTPPPAAEHLVDRIRDALEASVSARP